jgi:hypothetical protein
MSYAKSILMISALLATGCGLVSPSTASPVYVLRRIGDSVLPTPANPPAPFPAVVADTLRLPASLDGATGFVLTRTQVFRDQSGATTSDPFESSAHVDGDLLTIDMCPPNANCGARPIGWFPFELRFVGDSLVQQIPAGKSDPPRVYARVRDQ